MLQVIKTKTISLNINLRIFLYVNNMTMYSEALERSEACSDFYGLIHIALVFIRIYFYCSEKIQIYIESLCYVKKKLFIII